MFKQLTYELSRGLAYRKISHREMRTYTTWIPLFLTTAMYAFYVALPIKPTLVGQDSVITSLLTLVSTLPGFYFAGLAAVSTFGSAAMDQEMPEPAPEIEIRVGGKSVEVRLTRRLFLSYLFSYLVIASFALCFAFLALNALAPSIGAFQTTVSEWTGAQWPWMIVETAVGLSLLFVFSSMVVSTLHGVFFLTEKIHQP